MLRFRTSTTIVTLTIACAAHIVLTQTQSGPNALRLYVEAGIHHSARSVAFSHDGHLIAAGSLDRTIKVWNVSSRRELMTLPNGSEALYLVFFPSRFWLASSNENGSVSIWDLRHQSLVTTLACSPMASPAIAISFNGERLLCADEREKIIHQWNTSNLVEMRPIPFPNGRSQLCFSTDGLLLVGSDEHGGPEIISPDAHSSFATFRGVKPFSVQGIAFAPHRHIIVSFFDTDTSLHIWNWSGFGNPEAIESRALAVSGVHSVAFSPDERVLAYASEVGDIVLLSADSWLEVGRLKSFGNRIENAGFPDGSTELVIHAWYNSLFAIDLPKGALDEDKHASTGLDGYNANWSQSGVFEGFGFNVKNYRDFVRLENPDGTELCTLVLLDKKNALITVAPEGRFDTNMDLSAILGEHWIENDKVFNPLPLEIFMRDYYEPRLLPRLLACHAAEATDPKACETAFPKVRPLGELNRVQPEVKILGVRRGAGADEAVVAVEALGKTDPTEPNHKTHTDAYDLRLFRDGELVGQWPEPKGATNGPEEIKAWRKASQIPTAQHSFRVKLPSEDLSKPVVFTAYAFNEDRVKSETARADPYKLPADIVKRKPRAYVITVGVDHYKTPRWELEYAAKDAEDMSAALRHIQGYDVVPVTLVSEASATGVVDQATKANIHAALNVLATGRHEELAGVAQVDELVQATPDDVVILSFSGHGYTEKNGAFYLLPSDANPDEKIPPTSLPSFISSEELSEWLRNVDAGQMAMIIDACHSAASVPADFKPGPMGDRGLGQLAYDKGMRILAASQADDIALEIESLHQGLLTYALREGLIPGKDGKLPAASEGEVTLQSWLKYAELRVPNLYDDAKAGKVHMISRDPEPNPHFLDNATKHAQTPSLFDFSKQNTQVQLK
jgi:WD40 repeat protein